MSWICIDMERLCIVYKHELQEVVINLANLEIPEEAVTFMSAEDRDSFARFNDFELKALYQNITGTNFIGYKRDFLVTELIRFIREIKPLHYVNPTDLEQQLNAVNPADGYYQYVMGHKVPVTLELPYRPRRMMVIPDPASGNPATEKTYHVRDPSKLHKLQDPASKPNPLIPEPTLPVKRERATRDPNATEEAPKNGSKTGRVWEIADAYLESHPNEIGNLKSFSKAVKEICVAEGVNPSTASVQFSKWRASKSL